MTPSVLKTLSNATEVIQSLDGLFAAVLHTVAMSPLTRMAQFQETTIVGCRLQVAIVLYRRKPGMFPQAMAGVPPSDENHACQAAKYALDLQQTLVEFVLSNKPDFRVRGRIALGSGSLVGGVMNTAIPRFFVYGDLVPFSLRLLSSMGEDGGIAIGQSTKDLLDRTEYVTEPRGRINFRDKSHTSYWLSGTKETLKQVFEVHNLQRNTIMRRPVFVKDIEH
ncbi:hypothetical protein RvY_16195 [Ramazzottius varieornatus]|uniref:Guanylate cyclase domain-containing protein n=1 Tax=Ramazzottius varieornatus TaxID=947166 RepID=A0A1D1W221_RAMVA|nr:hypothetical protein RvY_16195 [Ramazzottius varieornatus]